MSVVSLTGADVALINDRIISDLADGDCITLDFPNELASLKTGKNGNTIYAFNQTGKQATMTMRVMRGSADDKFLNNLLVSQDSNFSGFVLMSAEFIKKIGDGAGAVSNDTYIMSGGIFTKRVNAKNNVEGDTEQSVSIYEIMFANSPRALT